MKVDSRLVSYYFRTKSALLEAGLRPAVGYLERIALERLGQLFRESMIGVVARSLDDDDERGLRAGLVASQLVGLAMTRYVWRLQPMADLTDDTVVTLIGPTIRNYLTGRLTTSADDGSNTRTRPLRDPTGSA